MIGEDPAIEELLALKPYSLASADKKRVYGHMLSALTGYHRAHCSLYRKLTDGLCGRGTVAGAGTGTAAAFDRYYGSAAHTDAGDEAGVGIRTDAEDEAGIGIRADAGDEAGFGFRADAEDKFGIDKGTAAENAAGACENCDEASPEHFSEEDIPMLHVGLFKDFELKSVPDEEVFKSMTSSGTTGQRVSNIVLDRKTAADQQKALVSIVSDFIGDERLPFLIIDSCDVLKNRNRFSARGAGIMGFSIFGSRTCYALDEDMSLNFDRVSEFLEKYKGRKILVFGFTYIIWKHFYKALLESGRRLDISNGILIHGGGWKKLKDEAVSSAEFRRCIRSVSSMEKIYNYYGMAEQTGCIYMECEEGHLHASIFSDIITRRAGDFSPCGIGEKGIIEVLSPIPHSYPGHAILTEDEGVIRGEDNCPCGRKGKYFDIIGRIEKAEVRGCSDTYEG